MSKPAFKFFQPAEKDHIPVNRSNKRSLAETLPFWPEFESSVKAVAAGQKLPLEAMQLNVDNFEKEMKGVSRPVGLILHAMRRLLTDLRIEKKVEVFKRGTTIYVCEGNEFLSQHKGGRRKK